MHWRFACWFSFHFYILFSVSKQNRRNVYCACVVWPLFGAVTVYCFVESPGHFVLLSVVFVHLMCGIRQPATAHPFNFENDCDRRSMETHHCPFAVYTLCASSHSWSDFDMSGDILLTRTMVRHHTITPNVHKWSNDKQKRQCQWSFIRAINNRRFRP